MADGLLPEGQQRQLDTRRVVLGPLGQVGPLEVGGMAQGGQEVVGQPQVQHLLGCHPEDGAAPSLDGFGLFSGQTFVAGLLEAEGGEEVLDHQPVLQFARLAQEIDQRLAMLHDDGGLGQAHGFSPTVADSSGCPSWDRMARRLSPRAP